METAVFSGGPNSEKEEEPFSIAFSSALRVAQGSIDVVDGKAFGVEVFAAPLG
jgi:hypothetical protein